MAHHYHATATPYDIPIILVGTQDAISESNPRIIDDARARKLASDLKRCAYYETCATYGLNVERVFQDGWSLFFAISFLWFQVITFGLFLFLCVLISILNFKTFEWECLKDF